MKYKFRYNLSRLISSHSSSHTIRWALKPRKSSIQFRNVLSHLKNGGGKPHLRHKRREGGGTLEEVVKLIISCAKYPHGRKSNLKSYGKISLFCWISINAVQCPW